MTLYETPFSYLIGKGYSVMAASIEIGIFPEGYSAAKSLYLLEKRFGGSMVIAETIYEILWIKTHPREA
ncbi:MAG: hypothetical protein EOP53_20495, partial [Sphingobacteriales bacterium]